MRPRSTLLATASRRGTPLESNMKVEFTYCVQVTVDEAKGAEVEKAIEAAVKSFDPNADVDETDATKIEEEGDEDTLPE